MYSMHMLRNYCDVMTYPLGRNMHLHIAQMIILLIIHHLVTVN